MVIFVTALDTYDMVTNQDSEYNLMEENKRLFRTVPCTRQFIDSLIILVLNKKDTFEEKIMHSHLVHYFPEFDGNKYSWIKF